MKLKGRDLVATILVVAIAVPYIGYLVNGSMPFVQDARGMTGVGLAFGALAFGVLKYGDTANPLTRGEIAVASVSLALGLAALLLAETAVAATLLALFMVSILVVWAVEVIDHAGIAHRSNRPTGESRG
ncbi:MAG TPA: hypothetical protein VF054_08100 [Micromonosporaceae bacterium]